MEKKTWREQYMMDQIDHMLRFTQEQMDISGKAWEEDRDNEVKRLQYIDWCGRHSVTLFLKEDFERLFKES